MPQRVWQGRIDDLPEKFKKTKIPDGYSHLIIYSNGSRTYHHGLDPAHDRILEISRVMSRCWDSLPLETKENLNSRI